MTQRNSQAAANRAQAGFTLIEMMITLLVTTFVLAGVFSMFNTLHKWSITTGVKADLQQSARIGLETFTRDLEMAGYHTTNYGDATSKTNLAITLADTSQIEMDQQRLDIATNTYEPRLVYYHVAKDWNTGKTNLYRQIRTEPGLASPDELVTENVAETGGFTLTYFDATNSPIAVTTPPARYVLDATSSGTLDTLRSIRRVDVKLTIASARTAVPIGQAPDSFTLTASVMPQNLENLENTGDAAAPAVPKNLNVVDSGSCTDKLKVKWYKNTEPDLAGYVLFYGTTERVLVPLSSINKDNPETLLNPDDLLITKSTSAANTYSIEIAAYDSSGNYSGRSGAVTGTSAQVTSFVSPFPTPPTAISPSAQDTTVNPAKPNPPTGVTVTTAGEYELVISWNAPTTKPATAGYRLYRSTKPFTDYSPAYPISNSLKIADELGALGPGVTSYTDTGLEGCQKYYYAVASVNCDETLVSTYVASDYALAVDINALPSPLPYGKPNDKTPPPPPSLAGSLAGWQRAFITLTNPTVEESADFSRTEIYFSSTTEPTLVGGVIDPATGKLIPDNDNGTKGTFTKRGSQVVLFDSETVVTPTEPTLQNEGEYHILAVSYDRCDNTSSASTALVLIKLCGDDPPNRPPSSPTNPTVTSCGANSATLGWAYEPKNGTPPLYDFAGYRIWRKGPLAGSLYPEASLNLGPTWLETWTDAEGLAAGGTYTYEVRVTDCVYENKNSLYPTNISLPLTIGPIYPGRLEYRKNTSDAAGYFVTTLSDELTDGTRPYTYHNNVRFFLENTSSWPVTLQRFAAAWENPNVVLNRVTIGPTSTTTKKVVNVGAVGSGMPATIDAAINDYAGGEGTKSGPIPVELRFTNQDGKVNRHTDMRNETLTISLYSQSGTVDHPGAVTHSTCDVPDKFEFTVPQGPLLGGFSQDAPGKYGIDSYEVTGPLGAARDDDMKVLGGLGVNVFGTLIDNARNIYSNPSGYVAGFDKKEVRAIADSVESTLLKPVMPEGTPETRELQSLGGDRYAIYVPSISTSAKMPKAENKVMWYYALAVDKTGNWDRAPNPDFGNYAYYQYPPNLCATAPAVPTTPVVTVDSTDPYMAKLTWPAITQYTDGSDISGTVKYDVYVNATGTAYTSSDLLATNIETPYYNHSANLSAYAFYYMVKAKNSCAPAQVSAASNVVRECVGAEGVYCSTLSVPASGNVGQALALSISSVCRYEGNAGTDSVIFRVSSDKVSNQLFTVAESAGNGGNFSTTITPVSTQPLPAETQKIWASSGTNLTVDLVIEGYTPCPPAKTVALAAVANDCDTIPKAPSPFSAVVNPSNSKKADITWGATTKNTDNSDITDLAGYVIEKLKCTNWNGNANPRRCDGWESAWSTAMILDATATSPTQIPFTSTTGRYKFRMKAFDSCTSPGRNEGVTAESAIVRIQ